MLNELTPDAAPNPNNERLLPHIYHFILDHRIGGPHVYVETLRKALAKETEMTIVTTGRGPATDMALPNLHHLWTPLYVLELLVNTLLLVCAVWLRRIRRSNVVFDVHGSANLAPIMAARITGIPVVWHFHETTARFRRLVTLGRWILGTHPHRLVVVANKAKDAYNLKDTILIPGAVDAHFWSRNQVSKEEIEACGWPGAPEGEEKPFRLLVIGNLNPLKGADILLEALAGIESPWHLMIVGAELTTHQDYARTLLQRARQISSRNKNCNVAFLGWQEKNQVRTLLASCDIYILPSRSEACPIALLEAMAMGCRTVAADVGDVRAMMKHYSSGKIFPNGSIDGLRNIIETMMQSLRKDPAPEIMSDPGSQLLSFSRKSLLIYNELLDKN